MRPPRDHRAADPRPPFRRVAFDAAEDPSASRLYTEIRREVFGVDLDQNSWLTAGEQDRLIRRLRLAPGRRVLDVGSGSGGPALRLARRAGCEVVGIELLEARVGRANAAARAAGLVDRVRFERMDARRPLALPAGGFDAVVCVDAVSVLGARSRLFAEWRRLLSPGGRAAFTDAAVVTGPVSAHERAMRAAIDGFVFTGPGENERRLEAAGLELVDREDTTARLAELARRWGKARAGRARGLRSIEGEDAYQGQQEFFAVTARAAREGRLSRHLFVARRP